MCPEAGQSEAGREVELRPLTDIRVEFLASTLEPFLSRMSK